MNELSLCFAHNVYGLIELTQTVIAVGVIFICTFIKIPYEVLEYPNMIKNAEMVAEAKCDAERTSQDIVAKAESDVEAMRERAKEDIAQAKDTALAEVFSTVNSQVAAATESRVDNREENSLDHIVKEDESIGDAEIKNEEEEELEEEEGET